MLSRTRGPAKTLWRLLLAAVQLAFVLAWTSTAAAEEEPSRGRGVGMCGTLAQSVNAPPPIYPGSEAQANPCTPPGEEFHVGVPLLPPDAPAALDLKAEKSAVLPPSLFLPKRLALPSGRSHDADCPGEEHRARALRPPQA